jgi:hypothetical protein
LWYLAEGLRLQSLPALRWAAYDQAASELPMSAERFERDNQRVQLILHPEAETRLPQTMESIGQKFIPKGPGECILESSKGNR